MNTITIVLNLLAGWVREGLSKAEIAAKLAVACMKWPYVFGGYGQNCTPNNRESYANRSTCPAAEAKVIRSKCPVLSGKKNSCEGCKWNGTLFFDCRGFTRWILGKVGITLSGGGATTQWNTASNWSQKGPISEMPNTVCCVFMQNPKDHKTMEHTGLHIGDGVIIHCSGEVKEGKTTDKGWTHYAIPKDLEGGVSPMPIPVPTGKPTLRSGSTGEYVTEVQTKLLAARYDLGNSGADGKFGAKTAAAVKAFQKDHGLKADGIVGKDTWAALDAIGNDTAPAAPLYTVTIPHLKAEDAEALIKTYPQATKAEEK